MNFSLCAFPGLYIASWILCAAVKNESSFSTGWLMKIKLLERALDMIVCSRGRTGVLQLRHFFAISVIWAVCAIVQRDWMSGAPLPGVFFKNFLELSVVSFGGKEKARIQQTGCFLHFPWIERYMQVSAERGEVSILSSGIRKTILRLSSSLFRTSWFVSILHVWMCTQRGEDGRPVPRDLRDYNVPIKLDIWQDGRTLK